MAKRRDQVLTQVLKSVKKFNIIFKILNQFKKYLIIKEKMVKKRVKKPKKVLRREKKIKKIKKIKKKCKKHASRHFALASSLDATFIFFTQNQCNAFKCFVGTISQFIVNTKVPPISQKYFIQIFNKHKINVYLSSSHHWINHPKLLVQLVKWLCFHL